MVAGSSPVEGILLLYSFALPFMHVSNVRFVFLSHEFCHFRDAPNRRTPSRRVEVCVIDGGLKRGNYFKSLAMYREKRTERDFS